MASLVRCTSPTPALGRRPLQDGGAERGGQLLGAEADAEDRPAGLDCGAKEGALVGQPGQVVVHAHGAAHDDQPRHVAEGGRGRQGVVPVHPQHGQVGAGVGDRSGEAPGPSKATCCTSSQGSPVPMSLRECG